MIDEETIEAIATDLARSFGTGLRPQRITEQFPGFSLDDGHAVADRLCALREARGEIPVGRKIGATNRVMWEVLGMSAPMWGFMFDTTVADLPGGKGSTELGNFWQPRIEPEIAFRLAAAPRAGMDEAELLGCIDGIAHGFELVHSPFSDWKVGAPDASAAYGLHMRLLLGPWHDTAVDRLSWIEMLRDFVVTLSCSDGVERQGVGGNVLGSPLVALKFLVDDLAAHPHRAPLRAGEIITTGTLTEAMPVQKGQTWKTSIGGAPLEGLRLDLR